MAWQVYRTHSLLCKTVPLFPGPHPGVQRFRRREPSLWQLGTVACQGKALAVEGHTNRGVNTNHRMTSHLCDPTRLRARGGFHKAGEGPAFGDSFPDFSSGRNRAQRSVPGGDAGFCRGNRRSKFFFLRKRRKPQASSFSYSSMAMSTPLTCTPSWARIKMYFTPSMTRVDTRSLCSAGRRTVTSAAATSTCLG